MNVHVVCERAGTVNGCKNDRSGGTHRNVLSGTHQRLETKQLVENVHGTFSYTLPKQKNHCNHYLDFNFEIKSLHESYSLFTFRVTLITIKRGCFLSH